MPASIGVNLRVTGHSKQGGRKYMEDYFSVAYQQTEDEKDLEYAFFGIFDGHGGSEAALFAKEHLMESIVRQRMFWSERDEEVLKAIKEGFVSTHHAMWKEQERWPRTATGLPSTAGTTASIAFIRRGKIFIGHVGDSGIVLGYQPPGSPKWEARRLTRDHKPENVHELSRIESCGGKVITKSGVPRVVWYRPHIGHKGPITRSTPHDEIPFLAVARSLGDLWSYNSANNEFIVSPEPDTTVVDIDTGIFRCLIFGTDGLWNMINPALAVGIVQNAEHHNAMSIVTSDPCAKSWINPSMTLVERALEKWLSTKMRADNTTVVTLMLDPPGPPRAQAIRNAHKTQPDFSLPRPAPQADYPENGLQIVTRYHETAPNIINQAMSILKSIPKESRYTEECLDQFHKLCANSLQLLEGAEPPPSVPAPQPETIQSNEVSSSSDSEKVAAAKRPRGRPKKNANDGRSKSEEVRRSLPGRTVKHVHDLQPILTRLRSKSVEPPNFKNKPDDAEDREVARINEEPSTSVVKKTKTSTHPHKRESLEPESNKKEQPLKYFIRSRSAGPTDLSNIKSSDDTEATSWRTRTRGASTPVPKAAKTSTRIQKRERFENDENKEQPPAKYFIRSRSLGPPSLQNIITNEENERNTKSRTKSTPKKTKMTTRLQKREWFDSDEENSEKDQPPAKYFIRSRSLGPRDLQDIKSREEESESSRRLRTRETTAKKPQNENVAKKRLLRNRSKSLEPRDIQKSNSDKKIESRLTRSKVQADESDEENHEYKRSRSLEPSLVPRTPRPNRNLRERNTNGDVSKTRTRSQKSK